MNNPTTAGSDSEHLLLAMAKTYPVGSGDLAPQGCAYSLTEGAWVLEDLGTLLVDTPGRPRPESKKADHETGEDQKGA
jgi:hypothetical protein